MQNPYEDAIKLFRRKLEMSQYAEYRDNKGALQILWQDCCRESALSIRYNGKRNLREPICSRSETIEDAERCRVGAASIVLIGR